MEFLRDLWAPLNHGGEAHVDECRQDKFAFRLAECPADVLPPVNPAQELGFGEAEIS